jgi:2'-5' RNA ligase
MTTEKNNLQRCFICLELPRDSIEYIEELQNQIKTKNILGGKYTDPENLHLTLKFLGEISPEKIEKVKKRLEKIKLRNFSVSLSELGLFIKKKEKILWIKLNGRGVFELQREIDENLKDLFEKENRFMSHITIARIKKIFDKKIFLEYVKNIKVKKNNFEISEFILKKSELTPQGPIYTDLQRYKIN